MTAPQVRRPLRARLQLAFTLAVLAFGALNILLVGRVTYGALRAEQDRRLEFVARLVAQGAARPLLVDDRLSLQKLLDESRRLDPDLGYIVVVGARGAVAARSGSPPDAPGRLFREASEKILDGRLGVVRVGVVEKTLRLTLGRIVTVVSLMVLAFLVIGLLGAALIARTVTTPLERLVGFASDLKLEGELSSLGVRSQDEIAALAERVEEMARRLQALHSEAKAHERELARVEHLAVVGTLAAGVAHEINNPLAGIRMAIERLLRQVRDPAEAARYAGVLRDAVARIERAVKGTLLFARAAEVDLLPTRLHEVVERALDLAGPRLEARRVSLVQSLPAQLPRVTGDPARLTQVLLNLVLNACDAMPDGGALRISAVREAHEVVVEVQDSGSGVPPEVADRIFDPFFTTKPVGQGTGLGLAVARASVREMGGELHLLPSPGSGAIFQVRLPVVEEDRHAARLAG